MSKMTQLGGPLVLCVGCSTRRSSYRVQLMLRWFFVESVQRDVPITALDLSAELGRVLPTV